MAEEHYWVVHIIGGERVMIGPYSAKMSAENRANRIHGGEVHVFRSWQRDPVLAEQEFVGEIAERL